LLPGSGHEPLLEQRLAIGGGNTPAPPRRPGRRRGLERGLDRGDDELRGLGVDNDVPAEQHAADDLPGMRGRVVRADGGLCHTRDCRRNGPGPVAGHAGFATPFYDDHRAARGEAAPGHRSFTSITTAPARATMAPIMMKNQPRNQPSHFFRSFTCTPVRSCPATLPNPRLTR